MEHSVQTWKKRVALHHPGNFFYTSTFAKFQIGYLRQKIIARLKKKKVMRLLGNHTRVRKVENYRTTKKKVLRAFTPPKNFFYTNTWNFFVTLQKNLHHLQKFYTILDGKDGNLFHLWSMYLKKWLELLHLVWNRTLTISSSDYTVQISFVKSSKFGKY